MANKEFVVVKNDKIQKSHFDLSHDVKMTANFGLLYPTLVMPCIPGDKVTIGCDSLVRFAPLIAPVMHMFNVFMHYFFVPYRILWPNWETYVTNGGDNPNPGSDPLPAFPFIHINDGNTQVGSLADYCGLPVLDANDISVSAFPFAAYAMIWDEYYRDQNLQDKVLVDLLTPQDSYLVDGDNSALAGLGLLRRAWEHDYFTSCLPFAQKGEPVDIPIANAFDDVPVRFNNANDAQFTNLNSPPGPTPVTVGLGAPIGGHVVADELYAETSDLILESTTINDLRRAYSVQRWLEKNARGGTRYIESNMVHFGVRSSDKRLQRPEYITGTKSPVIISEVLNTAGNQPLDLPQGNMAGHGVSVTKGRYGNYFCEEHGLIMGIMSVMPRSGYMQGIPRHYLMINDPTELPWPTFAHIGEQAVLNAELFAESTTPLGTFGYLPRYSEYKYMSNRAAGQFKSTLDYWTLIREFDSGAPPALNSLFVECDPDYRIFAVTDPEADHLYCQILHNIQVYRALPKFSSPHP